MRERSEHGISTKACLGVLPKYADAGQMKETPLLPPHFPGRTARVISERERESEREAEGQTDD